ncbi:MAG: DUF3060 domain-containing protein [Beutenbergiaceae bacterium]
MAGCSVSLDDVPGGGADGPASSTADGPAPSESDSAGAADPQVNGNADQWRQAVTDRATQTMNCDGGTLHIDDLSTTIVVTGPCDRLVVSGSSIAVVAEQVETLEVNGVSIVVLVTSISELILEGSSLQVYWSQGDAPSVSEDGVSIRYGMPPPFDEGELP